MTQERFFWRFLGNRLVAASLSSALRGASAAVTLCAPPRTDACCHRKHFTTASSHPCRCAHAPPPHPPRPEVAGGGGGGGGSGGCEGGLQCSGRRRGALGVARPHPKSGQVSKKREPEGRAHVRTTCRLMDVHISLSCELHHPHTLLRHLRSPDRAEQVGGRHRRQARAPGNIGGDDNTTT